jgi:excisionase family DNA binding protein
LERIIMSKGFGEVERAARRLWTVRETATVLGVSDRTIWRLVARDELKVAHIGRCVRIVVASAEALIEKGGVR